ncbi:MAG: HAMP domain-containing sensor histidine kinase [Cyclobacteriaceae bacterium]|jgi:signal transduction histidine kinase|nr:histidine kinase [Cytophagales bacterium]HNP76290.1 HAMP domain-containing sensor histidine kinase [Cyclobacteriaceae bacterium]HQQ83073.1 HAMP domain-containing sensor histidine kinase [Cyclobacteriaceae bacterium]
MNKPIRLPSMDFYEDNANLKWIVLAVSVIISLGTIYYTNILVAQLKEREHNQVNLFARALEYTSNDTDNNILFITEEIIFKNNSIPTILVNENNEIINSNNVDVEDNWSPARKQEALQHELREMKKTYPPIPILLKDPNTSEVFGKQYVYYKNSFLLTQLTAYPYIQLSVIAIFAFISYLAFSYSKTAEQNRVWVGLAKETAHQLGTPLSSLMAWVEVFRDDPQFKGRGIVEELDKDIRKLRVVTERFSSIGSTPVLKEENLYLLVNNVVSYLQPRVSSKINIEVYALSETISAMVHAPLFEWVIENLCKNAVDAMGSSGTIAIKILRGNEKKVFIDISDNGKGIPKSILSSVFKPGFTTKKRGWGLGLALAKRIIELYHNGRIFVKSSEENQGTTFRIELTVS